MRAPWTVPNYLGQAAQGQGMLSALPGANQQRSYADLQADMAAYQDQQAMADQLMQAGYVPNSGAMGAFAQALSGYMGGKMKKEGRDKLSDLLREQNEFLTAKERKELEAAAAAEERKRARDLEDFEKRERIKAQNKPQDPRAAILAQMSPQELEQSARVKYGLAPRPGSGTSVTVQGQQDELTAAINSGLLSPEEAKDYARRKFGVQLPLDEQMKADADAEKAAARAAGAVEQANSVLGEVQAAKGLVGMTTAGAGSMLAGVPGTPAKDLESRLASIKANLGFDRLQQMREQSPTGGALGAVAVQELTALQSTVASLDQAQSPAQLKQALDKIEGHYKKWQSTLGAQPQGSRPGEIIPNSQAGGKTLEELLGEY